MEPWEERKKRTYVYVFKSVHGTCNVVNYNPSNKELSNFLHLFDIWDSYGQIKSEYDGNPNDDEGVWWYERWYECSKDFYEFCQTTTMKATFSRLNAELVFEYPYKLV